MSAIVVARGSDVSSVPARHEGGAPSTGTTVATRPIRLLSVPLYHSKYGGSTDHVKPDHYDLVVEQVEGDSPRRLWHLTPEEATASTDSSLPRWAQARSSCIEWKRTGCKQTHTPREAAAKSTAVPTAGVAVPGMTAPLNSTVTTAGKKTYASMLHSSNATTVQAARNYDDWNTVTRQRKKSHAHQRSGDPQLVIVNLRSDTTKAEVRIIAERKKLDFSDVIEVQIIANGTRGKSCRAVLFMRTTAQANSLLRRHEEFGGSKEERSWDMRRYESHTMRGPRAGAGDAKAAPQASKLALEHMVPNPANGIYGGKCLRSLVAGQCPDGKACPNFHGADSYVQRANKESAARRE